jgi:chemotaxis family two-component system response regulator Rcp1
VTPQHFNILLVEDSPSDARLFEMALREVAPRVSLYWVATGSEAIEALRRQDRFSDILGIDVVIVDLNMPVTDGFETLEVIKKDAVLCLKPVLVMSSSFDPEDIRRAYRLGANTYFVKPMTLEGVHHLARCVARYWLELARLPPGT